MEHNICHMDAHGNKSNHQMKKQRTHSSETTNVLMKWLWDHQHNPYPSKDEKQELAAKTGLTILQIEYWFNNMRSRFLPKIYESQGTNIKNSTTFEEIEDKPSTIKEISEITKAIEDISMNQEIDEDRVVSEFCDNNHNSYDFISHNIKPILSAPIITNNNAENILPEKKLLEDAAQEFPFIAEDIDFSELVNFWENFEKSNDNLECCSETGNMEDTLQILMEFIDSKMSGFIN